VIHLWQYFKLTVLKNEEHPEIGYKMYKTQEASSCLHSHETVLTALQTREPENVSDSLEL
jgi:hypothetical protein